MKTGFNLLLWTSHVTEEHFPLIEKLAKAGYDGVEIPILEGTPAYYEKVRRVISDNGLACTAVTNMPDQQTNAVSPDRAQREKADAFMRNCIDCTKTIGASLLVGPFYQPVGVFTGSGPTDVELGRATEHARKAAEHAQKAGVTLAVEALNRFEAYVLTTMDQVADHVKAVGMPNYRAMMDTFHANIEENNVVESIRRHRDILVHVHTSENNRGVPGRGHQDWKGIFSLLRSTGYDGWLTIESFGRVLPAFAAATRIWRDIFESPEAVYTEGIRFLRTSWEAA